MQCSIFHNEKTQFHYTKNREGIITFKKTLNFTYTLCYEHASVHKLGIKIFQFITNIYHVKIIFFHPFILCRITYIKKCDILDYASLCLHNILFGHLVEIYEVFTAKYILLGY